MLHFVCELRESSGSLVPSGAEGHERTSTLLALLVPLLAIIFLLTACATSAEASPSLPEGIEPTTLAVGSTSEGHHLVILGTLANGAYVSSDGGESWTRSEGLPGSPQYEYIEPSVLDIAIASDGQAAFAATAAGLFKSTDSGLNWSHYTSNNANYEFRQVREVSIAPDYAESNMVGIVAISNLGGGSFTSIDGGSRWRATPGHMGGRDIQLLGGGQIGIATNDSITIRTLEIPRTADFRTPDGERGPSGGVYRAAFSPAFTNDNLVFIGGARYGTVHRLNIHTGEMVDSGLSIEGHDYLCDADVNWGGYGASPWCWLDAAYLSPEFATDGTGFIISNRGLARTTDSGLNWQPLDGPTPSSEPLRSIAFAPDFSESQRVYAVTGRRLLVSGDAGDTWQAYPDLDTVPPEPTSTPRPTSTFGPTPTNTPVPASRPGYLNP